MTDDLWTGERAVRWVQMAEQLDLQLTPVADLLFVAAALRPGERVLDVGCGTGPTTRRAARLVSAGGAVTGLDISGDMLAAARVAATSAAEDAPIEWVEADVATWESGSPRFDVVISRFGVMFFDDPVAAFDNLRRVTVPGGRLCVAVWGFREESELFELPLRATLDELARSGVHPDVPPPDGGPFSFGDPGRVSELLAATGWTGGQWRRHELAIALGGGMPPAEAAAVAMDTGPTRVALLGVDDDVRSAVHAVVRSALEPHVDEHGRVVLGGTIGIVSAGRSL
jgi:SAM-dependent methyltransferase